ncbi:MAG: Stp1/IreP family PP2C-type Ser/Thr phosphatase [Lachnospiraceae bacterium]|nr:Stp1/IreP family PP2C-type Ser/Thr phosphatase [Lachnospiraceae bacterium]
MIAYGLTDKGLRRENNEDAFFLSTTGVGIFESLFVVCDGMGGHAFGEVASEIAVRSIVNTISDAPLDRPEFILDQAISEANLEVKKASEERQYAKMGTTAVIAGIINDHVYVANIGDSRLYLLNFCHRTIRQITNDHSYVEEMVRKGLMVRGSEEYLRQKNIITRVLGFYSETYADFFDFPLDKGDMLLLCSDGLSNMVEERMMLGLSLDESFDIEKRVETLIHTANMHGGKDNITAVLVDPEVER